jgi:hypothetical protein
VKLDQLRFSTLGAHEQVEFVEWMSRLILQELSPVHEGRHVAERALRLISEWRTNHNVSGNELLDALMNQHDEGLFAYVDARNPKPTDHVFNVIGAAVSYAAWHAFRNQRAALPEGIEEVSPDTIQWLLDEAAHSPLFNEGAVLERLGKLANEI